MSSLNQSIPLAEVPGEAGSVTWSSIIPRTLVSLVAFAVFHRVLAHLKLGPYAQYKDLPPGPPSNVILGTPNYVTHQPHHWYRSLFKKYGPIVSVWKGRNLHIVLNTAEDIKELCEKRGTIYSSRPQMYVFHDIIFNGMFIASCPYNDSWRKQRKTMMSIVGPAQLKKLAPAQEYEAKQYCRDLLDSPENFYLHAERFGSSILTATVYGYRAHDITHPSALALLMMGSWMEHKMHPTRWLDDNWPILQRVPNSLAYWRWQHFKDRELLYKMTRAWWEPCKKRLADGIDVPCFATQLAKSYEADGWTDEEAGYVTTSLLLAGAGTTGATMNFFVMGCCTNPEAMAKVHEELDRVIGPDRLPEAADEPNLPYVRAMIKENLRWRPFSNQGFHHATTKDDTYKGFRIPAGTRIIPNAYSIHFDEAKYPNPDLYIPERYLGFKAGAAEAAGFKNPEDRDHFGYGAGRRICAGLPVAEASLFIVVSKLLWGFNITPSKDENGKEIPINTLAYDGGLFGKPELFKALITPRSKNHADVIRKSFAEATTDVRSLAEESASGNLGGMQEIVNALKLDPDCTVGK
ncbi:cytochrome P450 [Paraphoma chrysanthemicola]|uniref:Cytochrome P450 n=1 Tax=Paraphoma chrysanthemicola TaxID=798071 RepID=A0A8K0R091_9PLEO|nr:cytochrome P450 [Paraphoma chrysanthemicola]